MNDDCFPDATLIVLGHGTVLNDQSAAPVRQHVAELRRRKIFAEVRAAFWKQEPQIKTVLTEIATAHVFIVPFFISDGYFSTEIIPKELGFSSVPSTLNVQRSTLHYCRPVGSHELMTTVILARAKEVAEKFPFPRAPKPAETTLLIAGHGTERNKNSRVNIERQAQAIRALNAYVEVGAVFMDEAPFIRDCWRNVRTKNLIVVPFFISDGLHVAEDIPVLLGEAKGVVEKRLAAGQPTWRNPSERDGKLVWYSNAVGTEPSLAEVILERVRETANDL